MSNQIQVHTYNWGPCVNKLKIRDNFKELLLKEAKKSGENNSTRINPNENLKRQTKKDLTPDEIT